MGQVVTRKVDSGGCVSFAGATYRVGRAYRGRQVQVAIVEGTVEISAGGEVLRVHPIRHDRSREHGAFATQAAAPRASTPPETRTGLSYSYRSQPVTRVPGLDSP